MVNFVHEIMNCAPANRFYVHNAPSATPIWYTYSATFGQWLWTPDRVCNYLNATDQTNRLDTGQLDAYIYHNCKG